MLEIYNTNECHRFMAFIYKEKIMLLSLNVMALIYTVVFCIFFLICYFVIVSSRLESLFKQGSTWQIRAAQIVLTIIFASLATSAIIGLINNLQI